MGNSLLKALLCVVAGAWLLNAADARQHILPGHLPQWAVHETDEGSAAPDLPLNNLVVVLKRSAQQEIAFRQFLPRQQDVHSADYHHWLTSREIGERFGPSLRDIAAVTGWLQSSGLHVDDVANSRMFVRFSGSAEAAGAAFGTEFNYYRIPAAEKRRLSIASEPSIPASLVNLVGSISGLLESAASPSAPSGALPKRRSWNGSRLGNRPLSDAEWMTEYNGGHVVTYRLPQLHRRTGAQGKNTSQVYAVRILYINDLPILAGEI